MFEKQGFAEVILEEDLTQDKLLDTIRAVFDNRGDYKNRVESWNSDDSLAKLFDLITSAAN